jgi:hypothetical protein
MQPKMVKVFLWMGLFSSTIIYILLAFFLIQPSMEIAPTENTNYLFLVIGITSFLLAFILEKKIEGNEMTKFILGLAFNEVAAIMGLVAKIVNNQTTHAFILFAIAIVGFLVRFPKDSLTPPQSKGKLDV